MGLVATVGRWCFRNRWWVLLVWLAAVGAGVLSAGPVFDRLAADSNPQDVESVQAYQQLSRGDDSGGEVIALVEGADPQAVAVRTAVTALAGDLSRRSDVKQVTDPYSDGPTAAAMVARGGGGFLVDVTLRSQDAQPGNTTTDEVAARLRALAADLHAAGQPDATVRIGGNRMLNREAHQAVRDDLQKAEVISLPVTLVVLILVFGGLIAAGLPVIAAAVSVAAAMTVLLGFTYVTDLDQNVVTVVTLLGLGLSVDYGLLLVARYRDELGAGFAAEEAVARAWATAGRTILFSALTVAASLTGLLFFDVAGLTALGAAGVSIALVAMLTALTFTAALLGFARKRIKPSRRRATSGDQGFFARLSRFVQRWPWPVALVTAAGLLAAGLPLLSVNVQLPGLAGVPRSLEAAQVADVLADRFGLRSAPVVIVVVAADPATVDAWATRWRDDPAVVEVRPAEAVGPGMSRLDLAVRGGSQDVEARDLVKRVRSQRPAGARSWVTGDAAVLVDLMDIIYDGLPLALTVTVLAMMVLLFAMTGSVVVPVKAVLANVVSLGATFGVLVSVFQDGHGASLLDTLTIGGLDPFIMVIVFGFAFGLSMDYEVFLLGRIKEFVEHGDDSDTAVRRGLQHTGRIITSAAVLMVIVFGCFAAARIGAIEQVGLGLTVAVLIDATVVRCLLVPATMTLLGTWNWWAPGPLRRLHERIGLRETVLPPPPPPLPPPPPPTPPTSPPPSGTTALAQGDFADLG